MKKYEVRYMCDAEGELIGIYPSKEEAMVEYRKLADDMHPERAADLVIRTVELEPLGPTCKDLAESLIEEPYAWPGGYPRYALTDEGGSLCAQCVVNEKELIFESEPTDGWHVVAVTVNWEEPNLQCDHCNTPIESAY